MSATINGNIEGKRYTVVVTTTRGRVFVAGPFATIQKARKEQKRWRGGTWVKEAVIEATEDMRVA